MERLTFSFFISLRKANTLTHISTTSLSLSRYPTYPALSLSLPLSLSLLFFHVQFGSMGWPTNYFSFCEKERVRGKESLRPFFSAHGYVR